MTPDDTDHTPDFSSEIVSQLDFPQLGPRLAQLEEWGWVAADESMEDKTRRTIGDRIFPRGHTERAWNDSH